MKKRMQVTVMAITGMLAMGVFGITCPEIGFNLYMTTPATNSPEQMVSSAQMKARSVTVRAFICADETICSGELVADVVM